MFEIIGYLVVGAIVLVAGLAVGFWLMLALGKNRNLK